MTDHRAPSPLAGAALALLATGGTAGALRDRFAAAGASLEGSAIDGLLQELAELGLVRVARGTGAGRVFMPTSLGSRAAGPGSVAGAAAGEEAAGLLHDLERMRSDLLATIAHELRTPLTSIRTGAGLLRDHRSQPTRQQQDQLLESIERNAERMQRFVGDTLDLARFRAGHVQLQLRRFDAVELARSVVAMAFPAESRPVELHAAAEPVPVFGDRRRLEHALLNLVSNADRYSPPGQPIGVVVESLRDEVRWTVTDHGPGIPAADRGRLFERFFVGRGDRSAAGEGVGLGLPIALAIVQAHGGRIDVVSEAGQGSRFTIAVPAGGPPEEVEP